MHKAPGISKYIRFMTMAAVIVCLTGNSAFADSKFGLLFLGDRMWSGDARAISLGSEFQLLEDSLALQHNPATLTSIRRFTFVASGYFSSDRGSSGTSDMKETDASMKFASFAAGFPVLSRVSLGLGYRAKYDATSNFFTEKESPDGRAYAEFFNRTGGLTSFPVTAAVNVSKFLQLGMYYSVEQGTYRNKWDIVFADKALNIATSYKQWDLRGRGHGVGIVVRPAAVLSVGVAYDGGVDYDTEISERHTNSESNRTASETTRLPERWTLSAAWRVVPGFGAYATWSFSDFTKFEGLDFPGDRLSREDIVSLGVEYFKGLGFKRRRFPLRLGVTYSTLPYEHPVGESIRSVVMEFGVGLMRRAGRGKIDLVFQGGTTGDSSTNGLENRTIRVYLGVTGAEIWQRQRQDDF